MREQLAAFLAAGRAEAWCSSAGHRRGEPNRRQTAASCFILACVGMVAGVGNECTSVVRVSEILDVPVWRWMWNTIGASGCYGL